MSVYNYMFRNDKEKLIKDVIDPKMMHEIQTMTKDRKKLQERLDYLVKHNAKIFGIPEKELIDFGTQTNLEIKKV